MDVAKRRRLRFNGSRGTQRRRRLSLMGRVPPGVDKAVIDEMVAAAQALLERLPWEDQRRAVGLTPLLSGRCVVATAAAPNGAIVSTALYRPDPRASWVGAGRDIGSATARAFFPASHVGWGVCARLARQGARGGCDDSQPRWQRMGNWAWNYRNPILPHCRPPWDPRFPYTSHRAPPPRHASVRIDAPFVCRPRQSPEGRAR